MGFLSKMFNEKPCGFVNGGVYDGLDVKTIKEDGILKVCFYQKGIVIGKRREPFTFTKADLKTVTLLQSGVQFSGQHVIGGKTEHYIGNRYQLEFNNGNTAIVSCPTENAPNFEKAIF